MHTDAVNGLLGEEPIQGFVDDVQRRINVLDQILKGLRHKENEKERELEAAQHQRKRAEKLRELLAEFVRLIEAPSDPGEVPF